MTPKCAWLTGMILLGFTHSLYADTIYMKNGKVIENKA